MFWGLFTHPLLDSFTTWGTQLFWPLDLRLDLKAIFVIDPLYTLPFLIFLVMAMRAEVGSKKRENYNKLGLLISCSYLMLCLALKGFAYQRFQTALEDQQISYRQLDTKPSPFNSILWTANVEVEDAYLLGDYSFFDSKPVQFKSYRKDHHLLGDLRSEEKIQRLMNISEGWFIITQREGKLFFNDLRFGVLDGHAERPDFVFSYHIAWKNAEVEITEVERKPADAKQLLVDLGHRILGN